MICPKIFGFVDDIEDEENIALKKKRTIKSVIASPEWSEKQSNLFHIQSTLKMKVDAQDEKEYSVYQSKYLFSKLINNHKDGDSYSLFADFASDYTQFTVLDNDGEESRVFKFPFGFSFEKSLFFYEVTETIFEEFPNQISHIVCFGILYDSLTIVNRDSEYGSEQYPLASVYSHPDKEHPFQTYGSDYIHLGFLSSSFMSTPMMVVSINSFKDKITPQVTSPSCYYMELTKEKLYLIESNSNLTIEKFDLPLDWMTNIESLVDITYKMTQMTWEKEREGEIKNSQPISY